MCGRRWWLCGPLCEVFLRQGCLGTWLLSWVGAAGTACPLLKTEPPLFVPTLGSHCVSETSLFLDSILRGTSPRSALGSGTVPRGLSPRPGSSCLAAGEPRPGHRAMAGWRYGDEESSWPAQENMDPVIMIGPPAFTSALWSPGPMDKIALPSLKRLPIPQAIDTHLCPPAVGAWQVIPGPCTFLPGISQSRRWALGPTAEPGSADRRPGLGPSCLHLLAAPQPFEEAEALSSSNLLLPHSLPPPLFPSPFSLISFLPLSPFLVHLCPRGAWPWPWPICPRVCLSWEAALEALELQILT